MDIDTVLIENSWKAPLGKEFSKPYMQDLKQFLLAENKAGKIIYPPEHLIFNAFNLTPFEDLKVVILGQDPYHGPNQAHGLCFSVLPGVQIPPSLRNIYKELLRDLQIIPPKHGFLESWAKQGVLLLNTVLTVEAGKAASHQNKGWEVFTDHVILKLNARLKPIIFVLWGSKAQRKSKLIAANHHYLLQSAHPSPFSAYQGFSTINKILERLGSTPIDWQLLD
jgi:uracil-DNA glycosylase